jgi:hypothetical protein
MAVDSDRLVLEMHSCELKNYEALWMEERAAACIH